MEGIVIIPEGKRYFGDMPTHYRVINSTKSKEVTINALELDHASPQVTEPLVNEVMEYLKDFMKPVPIITIKRVNHGI